MELDIDRLITFFRLSTLITIFEWIYHPVSNASKPTFRSDSLLNPWYAWQSLQLFSYVAESNSSGFNMGFYDIAIMQSIAFTLKNYLKTAISGLYPERINPRQYICVAWLIYFRNPPFRQQYHTTLWHYVLNYAI